MAIAVRERTWAAASEAEKRLLPSDSAIQLPSTLPVVIVSGISPAMISAIPSLCGTTGGAGNSSGWTICCGSVGRNCNSSA
jgi:hypothetical protein